MNGELPKILVLIGGAQRSGTTLLQTLLAAALGSPNLPEAHILSDILASYKRARAFGNKTKYFYPTDDDLLSFFRSFAERHVADVNAGKPPALVLKDPNFSQTLDEAAAIFPRATRIVSVRDPRDIAASFMRIGERESTKGKPERYAKRDIFFVSRKIRASYESLLDDADAQHAVLVRYEDLVRDPEGTLRKVGHDTGLEFSLDRIERAEWLEKGARHQDSWVTELEGTKPSPASVGSYASALRKDEIAIVQEYCEPVMRKFGYQLIDAPRPGRRGRVLGFFGVKARPGKH
ncbi:MAG TPA: sulfotransferase [Methyloceanibacter sp.]|nr:sulfotransferase [Methyloceanibacter sp.]